MFGQMLSNKWLRLGVLFLLLTALVAGWFLPVAQEVALPLGDTGYNSKIVFQNGRIMKVFSGGEVELQSGSTLDVQSGTSVDFGGSLVAGTLTITGNSNLNGSVRDTAGILTLGDKVDVTGTARFGSGVMMNSTLAVTGTFSAEDVRSSDDGRMADDFTVVDNLTTNDLIATSTLSVVAGKFLVGPVPTAGGSGSVIAWTGTLNAMDNSDNVYLMKLAPTNANHTGTNNTLIGLSIGSITGDTEASEYGINVASGWDFGIFNMSKLNQYGNIYNDVFGTPDVTPVEVDDYLDVAGIFRAYGATKLGSTLAVTGTSDLRGNVSNSTGILTLNDRTDIKDVARFTGAAIFNSTLAVTGTATFNGTVNCTGNITYADIVATDDLSVRDNLGANDGHFSATLVVSPTATNAVPFQINIISGTAEPAFKVYNPSVGSIFEVWDDGELTRLGASWLTAAGTWTQLGDFHGGLKSTTGYFTTTLGAGGATDLLGSVSVEGPFDLGSHVSFTPTYTVNTPATWTLIPSASYIIIHSGGAVTMTLGIAGAIDGQTLVIYGDEANTVTINDVNLLSVGGSTLALTQYDVGMFIFIGHGVNKWAQISLAGNS